MKNYFLLAVAICVSPVTNASDLPAKDAVTPSLQASECEHQPPINIPETKLLHFDSPGRIPNAYLVAFKCERVLAEYAKNTAAHELLVLSDTVPTSQPNCIALASAFAVRYGGTVGSVWCSHKKFRAFSIKGISEEKIAALARDPRVDFVEPDMVAVAE